MTSLLEHSLCVALLAWITMTPIAAIESPVIPFPYDEWNRVLARFVDDRGFIDYPALAEDREELDRVIAGIASVSPRSHPDLFADRDHELAYYINAYNALVFGAVLDRGPRIDSVWGVSGSGLSFFVRTKHKVGGTSISLKKLEDAWVREEFEDPRIHAALNCASVGCPRLPEKPFSPDTLDDELDAAMTEFVSSHANVSIDEAGRTVTLSKIFDWFKRDFLDFETTEGVAKPSLIGYVNRYRGPSESIPLDYRVRFAKYDKRLNRQPE